MQKNSIYILLVILLLNAFPSEAQKNFNNWFFGNKTALSFNQSPPAPISGSMLVSYEGCSTMSDDDGNILFYSNGTNVFNKKNQVMQNGSDILGNLSSTSNSVIVLQPGSTTRYYLFVVGASNTFLPALSYSIIDMAQANGLGAVIEKNIEVEGDNFEKLAAARHCNKKDIWITIKMWNGDEYHSYLLTAAGLNLVPVISNTGFQVTGDENNAIGALKFSPDGKRLAAAYAGSMNQVEIMDFNNSTGKLSNAVHFAPLDYPVSGSYRGVYGLEFAPGGKLLYVSSNVDPTKTAELHQFDVSLAGATAIKNSAQLITTRSDWFAGGLQLGPDGKIYLALWRDSALSVIEDPDIYGPGCNFNYNKILLYKGSSAAYASESGLPNFVASDLVAQYANYSFSAERTDCSSKTITGKISYTADLDSVRWDFGDGVQSTLLSPVHTFPAFGEYTINLILYRKGCTAAELIVTTLQSKLSLTSASTNLPPDMAICEMAQVVLRSNASDGSYLWSTGETTDTIIVTQPGLYWLEKTVQGCSSRDSILISQKSITKVHLGNDTTVCVEKPVILRAPVSGTNFTWSDGSTGPTITVTKAGAYSLKFENASTCIVSDTINVEVGNCEIYFPSAFTPNGDTRNDLFGLINNTSAKTFELQIFDRNGQLVFQSRDQYQKWDGNKNGKRQPAGTYVWLMRFKPSRGPEQIVKGTVLLIR